MLVLMVFGLITINVIELGLMAPMRRVLKLANQRQIRILRRRTKNFSNPFKRIKELRTMAHKINVIDAPAGATLDIEMLNQPYPFGAKFSWEMFEDADGNNSTWTDLQAGVIGRRPSSDD